MVLDPVYIVKTEVKVEHFFIDKSGEKIIIRNLTQSQPDKGAKLYNTVVRILHEKEL